MYLRTAMIEGNVYSVGIWGITKNRESCMVSEQGYRSIGFFWGALVPVQAKARNHKAAN